MLRSISRKFEKVRFHLSLDRFNKDEVALNPTHLQLEPTVRCNLNCLTCSRSKVIGTYKRFDLTLDEIDRILAFFPNLNSVKLQGLGEPLLHPQIVAIFEKFKNKKVRIWTITNGTLLNSEKYRNILLDHVDDVAVSFDSVNKENFNYLRRGADMDRIVQGIKSLVKERDERKSDLVIGINFVISHQNYQELDQLDKTAAALKVDYVTVADVENWMIPGEEEFQSSAKFVAETRKLSPQIRQKVNRLRLRLLRRGIILGYKHCKRKLGNCYWPFKSVFITVEGEITPCCLRMHKAHSFGNLFELSSFEGLWNSDKYKTFRRSHLNKDASNLTCSLCPD